MYIYIYIYIYIALNCSRRLLDGVGTRRGVRRGTANPLHFLIIIIIYIIYIIILLFYYIIIIIIIIVIMRNLLGWLETRLAQITLNYLLRIAYITLKQTNLAIQRYSPAMADRQRELMKWPPPPKYSKVGSIHRGRTERPQPHKSDLIYLVNLTIDLIYLN